MTVRRLCLQAFRAVSKPLRTAESRAYIGLLSLVMLGVSAPLTLGHAQDITINPAYSCRLTPSPAALLRRGKVLTSKQAKSEVKKLNTAVGKLRQALARAKASGSKAAIQQATVRLNLARLVVAAVRQCLGGTLVVPSNTPTPTPTAVAANTEIPTPTVTPTVGPTLTPSPTPTTVVPFPLVNRGGNYTGTWNNTTFSSTGPISVALSLPNPTSFSLTLDLGGSVFGGTDPAPEVFAGTFTGVAPFVFTFASPLFGPNTRITVDANGDYQLDAPTPTNPVIRNFTLSLDFNDANGTAVGIYTLTAMGMTVNGTVSTTKVP